VVVKAARSVEVVAVADDVFERLAPIRQRPAA
jgi:hypothetical protein